MTSRQSIDTRLRKHLGLFVELDLVHAASSEKSTNQRLAFISSSNLAAGWYMLCVTSSSEFMGAGFDLYLDDHTASLQLGVSGLSRRIVHNTTPQRELCVSVDHHHGSPTSTSTAELRVTLSRLTRGYANARMENKCRRPVTYEIYDKFMRAYCDDPDYHEWLSRHPDRGLRALQNFDETDSSASHSNSTVENSAAFTVAADDVVLHCGADTMLRSQLELNSRIKLCYCDHEVINTNGDPQHAVMKPSWDITLLQSGNYVGRVFSCKKSLYDKLGGLDHSLGNSKEYDFLLRASHELAADEVVRMPAVMYAVHATNGSDPWFSTGENDRHVLEQYWRKRIPDDALRPQVVDESIPGLFRTRWPSPDPAPSVDIIIPTRDREPELRACIESILRLTAYPNYHIRVVDNDSKEPAFHSYQKSLEGNSRVSFMPFHGDFNYSAINNAGVNASSADIIVLLNNDTEVIDSQWLEELVVLAQQPRIGCVGVRLLYANSRVQHAGIVMGMKGLAGHVNRFASDHDSGYLHKLRIAHQASAVTAACLAIRRDVFITIGGLDDASLKVAFNDVDLCLRVAANGYDNILAPHITLLHHESVSRGADDTSEKAARFKRECETLRKRWSKVINDDPYWNPNLSLDSEKPIYAVE